MLSIAQPPHIRASVEVLLDLSLHLALLLFPLEKRYLRLHPLNNGFWQRAIKARVDGLREFRNVKVWQVAARMPSLRFIHRKKATSARTARAPTRKQVR